MPLSDYSPGTVCWAKLKGYPWWPARVEDQKALTTDVLRAKPKMPGVHPVFYFGSLDYGWVTDDCLDDFQTNYEKYTVKQKNRRDQQFRQALAQANDPAVLEKELRRIQRAAEQSEADDEEAGGNSQPEEEEAEAKPKKGKASGNGRFNAGTDKETGVQPDLPTPNSARRRRDRITKKDDADATKSPIATSRRSASKPESTRSDRSRRSSRRDDRNASDEDEDEFPPMPVPKRRAAATPTSRKRKSNGLAADEQEDADDNPVSLDQDTLVSPTKGRARKRPDNSRTDSPKASTMKVESETESAEHEAAPANIEPEEQVPSGEDAAPAKSPISAKEGSDSSSEESHPDFEPSSNPNIQELRARLRGHPLKECLMYYRSRLQRALLRDDQLNPKDLPMLDAIFSEIERQTLSYKLLTETKMHKVMRRITPLEHISDNPYRLCERSHALLQKWRQALSRPSHHPDGPTDAAAHSALKSPFPSPGLPHFDSTNEHHPDSVASSPSALASQKDATKPDGLTTSSPTEPNDSATATDIPSLSELKVADSVKTGTESKQSGEPMQSSISTESTENGHNGANVHTPTDHPADPQNPAAVSSVKRSSSPALSSPNTPPTSSTTHPAMKDPGQQLPPDSDKTLKGELDEPSPMDTDPSPAAAESVLSVEAKTVTTVEP
ncbi:hypothetical protein H4R33_004561 [Dimargaris cristalligena]|uniref:PWWP domain-containing protein n=1 Tax=Dimargaris cristalligena TaxID=215637 RepID=A0A4P9ZY54_9FUNG|nr:hypothetical protein H4R33_004561 [Dimargaris cristalligena]RKP38626.1 hypothetical protein BJ085DRAFT_29336 [Dimargaris cristalligena]|eukprot:RKP38626.1 hypothetical protein BJ085DRAFT_29336 [Dimargaris cristalligena]